MKKQDGFHPHVLRRHDATAKERSRTFFHTDKDKVDKDKTKQEIIQGKTRPRNTTKDKTEQYNATQDRTKV
jgi:hypothetical protein